MSSNLGFIPKEANVDFLTVQKINHEHAINSYCLDISDDLSAGKVLSSVTLVDSEKPSLVQTIPKGAKIEEVQIKVKNVAALDKDLEFCLGYFSTSVTSEAPVALLSQRVFADDSRVTGAALSAYGSLIVSDDLKDDKIVMMNKILGKDDKATPVPPRGVSVPEPIDLQPCITVVKGKLAPGTLSFEYKYKL